MSTWWQDVRYAFRRLSHSPGLAAGAVVSIALGIGANATIFSIVSRFVLRPAPVGEPGTLLALHTTQRGDCCNQFTWPMFRDVREQARSFSGMAAYYEMLPASVAGDGDPQRAWGQATTTNFFDVAKLRMAVGRGFAAGEQRLNVVVLGYGLWQRRFGGDAAIAGKNVTLSGRSFTVVGVAPRAFRGLDPVLSIEFWVPLETVDQLVPHTSNFASRDYNWLSVAGRLKPGVSRTQAAADLAVIADRAARAHPEAEQGRGFRFEQAGSLAPKGRSFIMMFLAALTVVVMLVLAIACANVANLLLAQAAGRQREMAVRRALGATRGQLLRQVLTESVLLALAGGLLGVGFSVWATGALSSLSLPAPIPLDIGVGLDWRTLAYTFALSVGSGVLFGLAPAAAAARPGLANAIKGADTLGGPGSRWSLRNVLIVSQIAMSLVLLCGTGLFLRSLQNAAAIDIGFRSRGVLMMSVDPRLHGYSAERTARLLTELRQRAAVLPGVISAACTDVVPLSMGNRSDGFRVEGRRDATTGPSVDLYMATSGYFDTLGITRIAGRDFGNEDAAGPKVAIVNEAFARRWFPDENPLGRRVSGAGVTYEIIGVVKNIKSRTLGEDVRPVLFRSLAQSIGRDPSFLGYAVLVRTAGNARAVASLLRREIRSLDPTMAIFNAQTMEEHIRSALFLPRLAGTLFAVFGGAGLLLAAVGLYGVMSYSISRRTREIGIRMALGSPAGAVRGLVVRQGMRLTVAGAVPGLAVAWAAAKVSARALYGVGPHDVPTFIAVPLFLAAIAFLACWIPARRAEGMDPLTALRHE